MTILCYVCLLICSCRTFKVTILFQLTFDNTTSLMYPTPAKLIEDGITAYKLSRNNLGELAFFCNFSSTLQQFTIALSYHSSGINPSTIIWFIRHVIISIPAPPADFQRFFALNLMALQPFQFLCPCPSSKIHW